MTTGDVRVQPGWTPPGWMNRTMTWMLKTPGIQRLVGRSTALLTFEGRKTGRRITMPVSYVVQRGDILLSGHRSRQWWRNLRDRPAVKLRLAGSNHTGVASVLEDQEAALDDFVAYLEAQPMVARINEVPIVDGIVDVEAAREALGHTVLVRVSLSEGAS